MAEAPPPRVWVDAQLPPSLARWLAAEFGVETAHVDELGLAGAEDPRLFASARADAARRPGLVVVTKDDDFLRLLDRHGPPPQVVWVTCRNISGAWSSPPGHARPACSARESHSSKLAAASDGPRLSKRDDG